MKLTLKMLLLIFFITICSVTSAQHVPTKERSSAKYRRQAQMEGNKVRASIFNHGQTGRETGEVPISEQTPYEWPKNSGKVYLALTGIFVGGQVVDDNGDTKNIMDVCNYRNSPEGSSWNFEPFPGYYNDQIPEADQTIANSVDPNTWPSYWPDKMTDSLDAGWAGSWNGFFGKNIFNADQELFYKAGDDLYDKYDFYFPDSTDLTRKGLGIVLDVRVMAWSQILVEDVVYIIHNVTNDGTKDIKKVGVTIWHADFVGGDGDSQDDWSEFDLMEDIAWSRDNDHSAPTFGSDPVGIVGVAFLETPGNAYDRIDNDGDGEEFGPKVTLALSAGEDTTNLIDDNMNGLIDENKTHRAFGLQEGVTYADGIDQNSNGEDNSPVITSTMVSNSQNDIWKRWPLMDTMQNGVVHLLMVESDDEGFAFSDFIDNDDDGEVNSDTITQAIIDQAAADAPYYRYKVPNSSVILYDVKQEDLGKRYADGKDNNGNGAIDENIDEGIDEMIDESRDNGIDDDGDWDPFSDDVGLDGVAGTGDYGEGDGVPTGGRNGLPGEPNVDATDVSETDQIGITNAQYLPAGGLNINSDPTMWFDFMTPGRFYNPQVVIAGEYDLFVSSSYFPLKAGQTEPISIAVILGNGPIPDPNGEIRKQDVLKKRLRAQETYNNDYQFANAPITPTLTAVPGNNRVTLYWDDLAEQSFDQYINNIGGTGNDFEGYRIYRTMDPSLEDITDVTNAYGVFKLKTPIAQFDLDDNYSGLDSVGFDGAHFDLGSNTGLKHVWIDSTAKNGFSYYYAITSYDFGYLTGGIGPSECPIFISLKGDGSVVLGKNAVKVTPEVPAAGYVPPKLSEIELVDGTTTGTIAYEIVHPNKVKEDHVYYITFEDTLIVQVGKPDIKTTRNFTLYDSTADSILINRSTNVFDVDYEQPLTDGFCLILDNEESVKRNNETSGWNNPDSIPKFVFEKFYLKVGSQIFKGVERPNDYVFSFGEVGIDTSNFASIGTYSFPAVPVNFKVYNKSEKRFVDFIFMENDTRYGLPGELSAYRAFKDRILLIEPNAQDSLVWTWWFYLEKGIDQDSIYRIPTSGDTALVYLQKPFLASDIFRFVSTAEKIDRKLAKSDLDKIKVVPNPYVANASWEPANPYSSGRGPRSIHFTHLPSECTIRIFTINGELVDTIEHKAELNDGAAHWDMLTKDNLSISYGVYLYHIDAPGIGEKMGKFAVIK